jgi:hypothetical protein
MVGRHQMRVGAQESFVVDMLGVASISRFHLPDPAMGTRAWRGNGYRGCWNCSTKRRTMLGAYSQFFEKSVTVNRRLGLVPGVGSPAMRPGCSPSYRPGYARSSSLATGSSSARRPGRRRWHTPGSIESTCPCRSRNLAAWKRGGGHHDPERRVVLRPSYALPVRYRRRTCSPGGRARWGCAHVAATRAEERVAPAGRVHDCR